MDIRRPAIALTPTEPPDELSATIAVSDIDTRRSIWIHATRLWMYLDRMGAGDTGNLEMTPADADRLAGLDDDPWTTVNKYVNCGKCNSCPHGPYVYLVKRAEYGGAQQEWVYIGPGEAVKSLAPDDIEERVEEAPEVMSKSDLDPSDVDGSSTAPTLTHSQNWSRIVLINKGEPVGELFVDPFAYRVKDGYEEIEAAIGATKELESYIRVGDGGRTVVPLPEEERAQLVGTLLTAVTDLDARPRAEAGLEARERATEEVWTEDGYGKDDARTRTTSDIYPSGTSSPVPLDNLPPDIIDLLESLNGEELAATSEEAATSFDSN